MSSADAVVPQSAVLPFRRNGRSVEFLLVTSLTSHRWVLPKGHIDAPLSAKDSAAKEAFEEAGISGRLVRESIGTYSYTKHGPRGDTTYRVEVYAMEVKLLLDTWPEQDQRQRVWMSPDAAAASVEERELRDLLRAFAASVGV